MPHFAFSAPLNSLELETAGAKLIDAEYIRRRPEWVGGSISHYDAKFLSGLLQHIAPKRVVEIGVASGWSSAVILRSLGAVHKDGFSLTGIDLFEDFYLDKSKKTGGAVSIVEPTLVKNYNLITGMLAIDGAEELFGVEFLFIDAHHMHPWATIDLLSMLPALKKDCWVALHDVNMCVVPKNKHQNRGPYYLYNLWPDKKINSTQIPSMIGAVNLERDPIEYVPNLVELLYTPWEVEIDRGATQRLSENLARRFGRELGEVVLAACNDQNARFKQATR